MWGHVPNGATDAENYKCQSMTNPVDFALAQSRIGFLRVIPTALSKHNLHNINHFHCKLFISRHNRPRILPMPTHSRKSTRHQNPWCINTTRHLFAHCGMEISFIAVAQLVALGVSSYHLGMDFGIHFAVPALLIAFLFGAFNTTALHIMWGKHRDKFQVPLAIAGVLAALVLLFGLFLGDFLRSLGFLR